MDKGITAEQISAEIAAYLDEPDYHAEGYVSTAEIAQAWGISVDSAYRRLNRAYEQGRMDKRVNGSRMAWWKKKE
jgi:hypothetical protein